MFTALATLIDRLDTPSTSRTDVISWGAPVPSFGDLFTATVATLGLNPSNREFVDEDGNELSGTVRRFHTLNSLGLESWADADSRHLQLIIDSCRLYFDGNPYDRWFKRLDQIVLGANASYYSRFAGACHLDLIPYATSRKWTELAPLQKSELLSLAADTLALLLRDSEVRILILNGRSVVDHFQVMTGVHLDCKPMREWSLPRQGTDVQGFSYTGTIVSLSNIQLRNPIKVLGYNHNIQSSFGVTTKVIHSIRDWIASVTSEGLNETERSSASRRAER
jgi:hypothetical protein